MFPDIDPHRTQKWFYAKYPITWSWGLYWYSLVLMKPKKEELWKDFNTHWDLALLEEEY